ncbi:MAG: serine/threonine protein kinase [Kofleriaceae bacterium]
MSPRGGRCAHGIPDDAPAGLCPRCALGVALTASSAADPSPAEAPEAPELRELGDYQLEAQIARGGMGVVYRARHRTLGRKVAIKVLVGGVWSDDEARARFRAEAELAASLEHEHIVPIYEIGEHDGQPYYAMRLMEESLAAHVERAGRLTASAAAALVASIARAVHWGHARGVLHRDLKPENILLDAQARPHVGDFGVSLRLGPGAARRTDPGAVVGTPGYLAPEQAGAFGGDLTVAVDVWGLGAVLYELLCGRPPFAASSPAHALRLLLEEEPPRPRALCPGLDRDLETVCLRCLEKEPERRYGSALELALELERVLRGEPIEGRRRGRLARLARFGRRHPVQAGAAASAAVFLAALAVGSTLAARAQERELAQDALNTNAWVARGLAGAVHFEMRSLADQIERAAQEPALIGAALAGRVEDAVRARPPFDSVLFLDERGVCQARWPASPELLGRDLSFRDYARAVARAERGQAVVAPAYRSEVDATVRFAVAAPVFHEQRRLGALVGTVTSDATLGALSMRQEDDARARRARTAILLSRHGAERASAGAVPASRAEPDAARASPEWLVVAHPSITRSGADVLVDARDVARLERTGSDPRYRDPLVGDGVFLAGFAAVADLPFAVIVETPVEQAIAPNARWMRRVASAALLAAIIGVLVLVGSVLVARRRRALA